MANATARVGRTFRSYRDEILTHSYGTVSSKTQLYITAMLGLSAGYLAKFDDTASMKFFGLVNEKDGNPFVPTTGAASGTAGDGTLDVDVRQPPAFELAISGVAITDIGRRVYAVDDQTGTLDPSTTVYANLIGTVKDLVYAMDRATPVSGYALVSPTYNVANGEQIQIASASGAVNIKASTVVLTKAGVAVMTINDPTSGTQDGLVMKFISSTSQAHTVSNAAGSGWNNGGGNTATFGGAKGDGFTAIAFGGKWLVVVAKNVSFA